MSKARIQTLRELEAEMRGVARGEKRAPKGAAKTSFEIGRCADASPHAGKPRSDGNDWDKKPSSIAELAKLTGRAASNLTRTLQKLEAAGLVEDKFVRQDQGAGSGGQNRQGKDQSVSQYDVLKMA